MPVLRLISDSDVSNIECAEIALRVILYLSSSVGEVTNQCVEALMEAKAIPRLVELVLSTTNHRPILLNLALATLTNLTRTEPGAVALVGTTLPDYAVKEVKELSSLPPRPTLQLLLERFLHPNSFIPGQQSEPEPDYASMEPQEWDTLAHDPMQHFAAILVNATQVESGRKFVMRIPQTESNRNGDGNNKGNGKSVFELLLPQLQSTNPIRRRGISGMIRNCCLDKEAVWWMLNIVKIVTPLLYPLAGPEELDLDEKIGMDPDLWLSGPDKQREYDTVTRQNLVDTILLLCASGRQSRKTLRLARTYVILKYADMVEESETVSERISDCVQYLRRDEEGTDEGSSDRMVEEHFQNLAQSSEQITGARTATLDYDDVD